MKTWTVVVEIKSFNDTTENDVKSIISEAMENMFAGGFQIFEVTAAPYGPQGVILQDIVGRAGRIKTAPILTCSKTCKPIGGGK